MLMKRLTSFYEAIKRKNEEVFYHRRDIRETQYLDLPELTDDEFAALERTWPCFKFDKKSVYWARVYKKEVGFDPYYISTGLHNVQLKAYLNPTKEVSSLVNKALVDVYLPEIPFPKAYVRCVHGNYYDREMNHLSFEDAVAILKDKGSFVIKPALDSSTGNGVKRIDLTEESDLSDKWFASLFKNATSNFIAQEVLAQHPDIARLNPTSLNCCRVTSVFLDGKYTKGVCIKIGKKGSKVDNWNSSYLLGVKDDGTLESRGWDNKIQPVEKTDNGIAFGGLVYPCYTKMVESAERWHKKFFPQCCIVGWDIIIDDQGEPRVIEANMVMPGILAEQLCSGPFFKDVHDEICKKILSLK